MPAALEMTLDQFAAYAQDKAAQLAGLNFGPALRQASRLLSASWLLAFERQASPDGVPWPPWAAATARRKGAGARLLYVTGALAASGAGGPGFVYVVTAAGLVQGSSLDYAGFHQRGTRTIPAREFAGASPATLDRIGQIFAALLENTLTGA